jgi:hypothetical protein
MHGSRSDRDKGKGNLGCLFSLLLLVAFIYTCYIIIPIYYRANEFQSATEREVDRVAAKYLGDAMLRKNIMSIAAVNQIPLEEKNLQIIRTPAQIAVNVVYFVPAQFPMYRHTFRFEFRLTKNIGAL